MFSSPWNLIKNRRPHRTQQNQQTGVARNRSPIRTATVTPDTTSRYAALSQGSSDSDSEEESIKNHQVEVVFEQQANDQQIFNPIDDHIIFDHNIFNRDENQSTPRVTFPRTVPAQGTPPPFQTRPTGYFDTSSVDSDSLESMGLFSFQK